MSRLVGGLETLNRLVPHPSVTVKNWEGCLGYKVSPEDQEALVPSQEFLCWEEKSP